MRKWIVLLMLCGWSVTAVYGGPPQAAPNPTAIAGYGNAPADPQDAGYHALTYKVKVEQRELQMPFILYVPEGYKRSEPRPMLVFLAGLGERGADPHITMNCGVMRDLASNPELQKWVPFLILAPACPSDSRWEQPGMAQAVVQLIRKVAGQWNADPSRLYLTGLSMGGNGCWYVAAEAPDLFAAVAPVVANVCKPAEVARKLKGQGTRLLIIAGGDDPKSTPGSRLMALALRGAGIDVTLAEIPHAGHGIWSFYYSNQRFYSWLLDHRRGQPNPKNRLNEEDMIGLFYESAKGDQQFQTKLATDFHKFLPFWFLDNCSQQNDPGLKGQVNGQKNVFATRPLAPEVACRLQTTANIPAGKKTTLKLVVGHEATGSWNLLVRVNEVEQYRKVVSPATSQNGWMSAEVDLTPWAGKEARIQVAQLAQNWEHPMGYWQTVEIVSQ